MPELVADCSQCAALCCVAMAFDEGEMFACDKPAGVACQNLSDDKKCKIYDSLEDEGFRGCVQYDCLGAGQRVVQEMFPNTDWRKDKVVAPDIFEAFRIMRLVHQWLEYLETAADLPLDGDQEMQLEALYASLKLPEGYDLSDLMRLERSGIGMDIQKFLRSLADTVRR